MASVWLVDLRRGLVPHGVELSDGGGVGGAEVGDELLTLRIRELVLLDQLLQLRDVLLALMLRLRLLLRRELRLLLAALPRLLARGRLSLLHERPRREVELPATPLR